MDALFEHHRHNIRFRYRCFDRILLNAVIQPFQQPERVVGFFGTYRAQYPVSCVAGKRIVAKQLRSAVGRADLSPWKTEWHPSNDSSGKPGQTVRT